MNAGGKYYLDNIDRVNQWTIYLTAGIPVSAGVIDNVCKIKTSIG